jgi:hypothetical protein
VQLSQSKNRPAYISSIVALLVDFFFSFTIFLLVNSYDTIISLALVRRGRVAAATNDIDAATVAVNIVLSHTYSSTVRVRIEDTVTIVSVAAVALAAVTSAIVAAIAAIAAASAVVSKGAS